MNRAEKKEVNKKKILDALAILMEMKTLDEISANEICTMSNLSKRTLYSYYDSKISMYLALIKVGFEKLNAYIEDCVPKDTDMNTLIEALGRGYLNFIIEERFWGKLILEYNEMEYIESYPEMIKEINGVDKRFELSNIVHEYREQGFGIDNTTVIALWSQVLGLAQLIIYKETWLCEYYKMTIDEIIESQMDIMRKLIKNDE